MTPPGYPLLYQVNTRVWLTQLSELLGRRATLDDIPESDLDRLAALGVDWIWLLSVWRIGETAQRISRIHPELPKEYKQILPDLQEQDIGGSGFAISDYAVSPGLGGDAALARLRKRMGKRNLRLMLDFVPNHTALDHPWVQTHPEYYVAGTEADLAREPGNYIRLQRPEHDLILAHGRDPHFPGWSDTLQLDYSNRSTQQAMLAQLIQVSSLCDGVRCDMAMLLLPEVFERTWGRRPEAFWPGAVQQIRKQHPGFLFLAEAYWDLESSLLEQGFDFAYDKRLYDCLREKDAAMVRKHLRSNTEQKCKLAHFLENHDEPRAAAIFPPEVHQAAALVTYLVPGMKFFHLGQFEGRKKRIPVQLVRAPKEPVDQAVKSFYERLLAVIRQPQVRMGEWQLLECLPAWEGNWTADCYLAFAWQGKDRSPLLVVVNYAGNQSQCCVRLPVPEFRGRTVRLDDLLGTAAYERDGNELVSRGLYVDLAPWAYHVFELSLPPNIAPLSLQHS